MATVRWLLPALAALILANDCTAFTVNKLDQVQLNVTLELIEDLTVTRRGMAKSWLAEFVDDYGPRRVATQALEDAIDHMVAVLKSEGFSNVHTEDVPGLPNWIRGDDKATITQPRQHKLNILAIGGSPSGQVEADAIVLNTLEELNTTDVKGKIVVFNYEWTGYTTKFRNSAKKVAAVGGVGVLVRSVTPFSIYSPHTGAGAYDATIPAACITVEESLMMQRWQDRKIPIRIKLDFSSQFLGWNAMSRNVIFEIPGSDLASEVVIFSGHIDSWDVGQGAMDDGGGMAAAHEMMINLLAKGKASPAWVPRRTIRGIFWTAEEPGMMGAEAYFNRHYGKDTNETIVFAAESDEGAFRPLNSSSTLTFSGPDYQKASLQDAVTALNQYGIPLTIINGNDMIDLEFLADAGVPCTTYQSDRSDDYYWYFHHTNGDYVNVFDDDDIQYVAAIWSAVATKVAMDDVWSPTYVTPIPNDVTTSVAGERNGLISLIITSSLLLTARFLL